MRKGLTADGGTAAAVRDPNRRSAQVFSPLRSALITLQQSGGLARAGRAARNGIAAVVH